MFRELLTRMIAAAKGTGMVVVRCARESIKPKSPLVGLIADLTRTRAELESENAALRQQVTLLSRSVKKPKTKTVDGVVLVLASAFTATWRDAVLVVKPDTVSRWHRRGFRLFWAHKSRKRKTPQPKISTTTLALIKQMAAENRTWGAELIQGELLKLEVEVAKLTVQRYMKGVRPTRPRPDTGDVSRESQRVGLRFPATL